MENRFYTTLDCMTRRYDEGKRLNAFSADSQDEFHKWRDETRKMLINLLGIDKIKPCEIEVKKIGREKVEGFFRDKNGHTLRCHFSSKVVA